MRQLFREAVGHAKWVIGSQQGIRNSRGKPKNNRLWAIGMDHQEDKKGGGAIRCSERVTCSKHGLERRIRGETEKGLQGCILGGDDSYCNWFSDVD